MKKTRVMMMAIALSLGEGDAPPTEFRLFKAGWNNTQKGRFLFDDKAAVATMAAYREWGVDLMIDLEHQSLDPNAPPEPTARDARGWCALELRSGELWAVSVKWTEDGANRLSQKRQRYVSPAFTVEADTKRITSILNIAICAMPATNHTPALIAAAKTRTAKLAAGGPMDPKLFAKALDAIEKGDANAALDILKQMLASAAGADVEDAAPPAGDGGADETQEGEPALGADPEKQPMAVSRARIVRLAAMAAGTARLLRATGATTISAALDQVDVYRGSHVTLETERQKLSKEREAIESAERQKLCVELVTDCGQYPSTVWTDDKATTPKPRWAKMEIAELRAFVEELRVARGKGKPIPPVGKTPAPPVPQPVAGAEQPREFATPNGVITLSARELRSCAETGAKPEEYAANKAIQLAARAAGANG